MNYRLIYIYIYTNSYNILKGTNETHMVFISL